MNRTELIQLRKVQLQNATVNAANKLKEIGERVAKSVDTSNYTETITTLNNTIVQQQSDIVRMRKDISSSQREAQEAGEAMSQAEERTGVVQSAYEICYALYNAYAMLEKHLHLTSFITVSSLHSVYVSTASEAEWSSNINNLNTIEKSMALKSRASYVDALKSFVIPLGSQFFLPQVLSDEKNDDQELRITDKTQDQIKALCQQIFSKGQSWAVEMEMIKEASLSHCFVGNGSGSASSEALDLFSVYCNALYATGGAFAEELDDLFQADD